MFLYLLFLLKHPSYCISCNMILISINHFYEVFLFVYKMKYKLMII